MTNLKELRIKARRLKIKGRSKMKSHELEEIISGIEKEAWYQENVKCDQCLHEQYIQKKIDKDRYNQQLLNNTIRQLVCDYCDHSELVIDGAERVCNRCGTVQGSCVEDYRHWWQK